MSSGNRLPMVDLNRECSSASERLKLWSDWTRPLADFAPLNWRNSEGLVHVRAWPTDKAVFSDTLIGPHVMVRKAHHLRSAKPTLSTRMHVSGYSSSEVRTDAYVTKPGDLNVVDFTETYSTISTRVRYFNFIVPHETVNYDPAHHPAHLRLQPEGPKGAALAATFRRLMKGLPTFSVIKAEAAIDHFLALFARMLEDSVSDKQIPLDPAVKRQAAMRTFVENSLRSPDLMPSAIAEAFSVSRATVYRDLKDLGGLQRYVLRRRLEEACKELVFSPNERGIIGDIAHRWQFGTTAHFSREFRRRFGFSPNKAVNSALFQMKPQDPVNDRRVKNEETPEWLGRL